jgi:hypothetical protein
MRERLLRPLGQCSKLHKLLVLFTLLLALPQTTWGGDSYFGINTTNKGSHWVSDDTYADVLEDGSNKITYDRTNKVLTLNSVELTFSSTVSNDAFIALVDDLNYITVNLVGNNTLTLGDKACFFYGTNITFTTDGTNPGSLTIVTEGVTESEWSGMLFVDKQTSASINPFYTNGLSLTQNGNTYIVGQKYDLTVGGISVTNANSSIVTGTNISAFDGNSNYMVSYLDDANTIILQNAKIWGPIKWEKNEPLTIKLIGDNQVGDTNGYALESTNNVGLNIVKGDDNNSTFKILHGDISKGKYTISGLNSGFAAPAGMYKIGNETNGYVVTTEAFELVVSGNRVQKYDSNAPGYYTNILGDDLSNNGIARAVFDPNSTTLTLKNANISSTENVQQAIVCGYEDLTIDLQGSNTITSTGDYALVGTNTVTDMVGPNGQPFKITFTSTTSPVGSLTITSGGTSPLALNITVDVDANKYFETNIGWTAVQSATLGSLGITVAGTVVTIANATTGITAGSGKVYYNATDNILTLDGASINGAISTELNNLNIKLKGANSITTTNTTKNGIISNKNAGTLTFAKEGTGASLNISSDVSVIRGFASLNLENSGLYIRSSTPYKMKSNAGYTRLADATKEETDTTAITSFYISESVSYQLWVAGNQVTEANKGDIFVEGTASPTASFAISGETKTLTLNAANITGMIVSAIGNLTIHLTGNNKINATGTETSLIKSTNDGTLTFDTDATPIGSLEFLTSTGGPFANTPWSGFTNVAYNSGLDYSETASSKKVGLVSYSLNIGINQEQSGTEVTSANKNDVLGNGGKVTFDSENHILTLNGATISGSIFYEGTPNLTIALKGTNSVTNSIGTYAINSTGGSLNIVKATDATSAELTLNYGPSNIPISASYTLGSGLYLKPITSSKSIITEDPEFVTVDGFWIPDNETVSDGATGTITYSASDKTLTITSFSKTFYTDAIKTGVSGLKVKLVGASTITSNSYYAFSAFSTGASIQFVKNDASSKLTMVTGDEPFNGFAAGAITYKSMFYSNKVIMPKATPTISFTKWNPTDGDYTGGNVGADEILSTTFVATYKAPKPIFSNSYNNLLSYPDSTRYKYTYDPTGIVEIPITNTDALGNNTFNDMVISKAGTVTITCSYPGNNENEPCSASYTMSITRNFNNPFANQPAEQIYATYMNWDEDLTLPDGIVAYIVTGIIGNTVTTTATGYLPQNVPVLLEKTGTVGTTVTGYTGSAGNFSANLMDYASADRFATNDTKYYVLYNNEFVKAIGNITGKYFLDLSSVSFTRGAYGIGDGSTAIKTLQLDAIENEIWFDLQGRRIDKPTRPGLYIRNGKKVVVNNK